jgi:transitional endoplasmic reticulum ATPase
MWVRVKRSSVQSSNRPQDIDVALRRPGRFDWQIHFAYPTRDDREQILTVTSRNLHVASKLSHDLIADRTEGWSPAELNAIWSDAALLAVRDGRDVIFQQDYWAGFERVAKQRELVAATQRRRPKEGAQ